MSTNQNTVTIPGQLGEDAGEVDAGRGPGGVEGHHPDNVLVSVQLLREGVVPEVDRED